VAIEFSMLVEGIVDKALKLMDPVYTVEEIWDCVCALSRLGIIQITVL
jgi:hypothetical protein